MFERPDNWLFAVILWAATWRVTHLLQLEEGPYKVITRLRALTGVKHDDNGPIAFPDGNVFECFLCLSIWVAVAVTALATTPAWIVLVPLAVSGAAIWANGVYHGSS